MASSSLLVVSADVCYLLSSILNSMPLVNAPTSGTPNHIESVKTKPMEKRVLKYYVKNKALFETRKNDKRNKV